MTFLTLGGGLILAVVRLGFSDGVSFALVEVTIYFGLGEFTMVFSGIARGCWLTGQLRSLHWWLHMSWRHRGDSDLDEMLCDGKKRVGATKKRVHAKGKKHNR